MQGKDGNPNAMWWHPDQFLKKKQCLATRMIVTRAVRTFFDNQDFWEVETPALQICPTFDPHIHAFKTELRDKHLNHKQTLYLHTSPELDMKKLLVAGLPKIYQICHVYRNGDQSSMHSPEFSMIEWYQADAGYNEIMDDCIGLLRAVAEKCGIDRYIYKDKSSDPFKDWQTVSVSEAFESFAGIDLTLMIDEGLEKFKSVLKEKGIYYHEDDRWDDLFFRVFMDKIEPFLGQGVPTLIYDYPASMAALSQKKPEDPRFSERFELFVCGLELANAFGELTDATEQEQRFHEDMALKEEIYGERYPLDKEFIEALKHGMPRAGGIALGMDRLAMLAAGTDDIFNVLFTKSPGTLL